MVWFIRISTQDPDLPLLSQNISIVVGAYSQIFEKFIYFLGIRSLIVTDLDTLYADGKACEVGSGVSYSNSALSFFFGAVPLTPLKGYSIKEKILEKKIKWIQNPDGTLCIVYQIVENAYNARSFEDAFININRTFIEDNWIKHMKMTLSGQLKRVPFAS
ncbi:MAG: hypothetical protein JWR54_557 [Mucilaginibacter sp.]|nr:hypothetical protein [Mucilaginibacter sp.]